MRSSSAQLIDTDHINMVTKKMTHKATANRRSHCERVYYDQLHYLFISLTDVVQTSVKLKQKKKKCKNKPPKYLWKVATFSLIIRLFMQPMQLLNWLHPLTNIIQYIKITTHRPLHFGDLFLDVCLRAAGRFLVSAFRTNSHGIWCVISFSTDVPPILLTCLFWVSSIGGTPARLMSLFMYVMTRAWLAVSAKSISSLRSGQKV